MGLVIHHTDTKAFRVADFPLPYRLHSWYLQQAVGRWGKWCVVFLFFPLALIIWNGRRWRQRDETKSCALLLPQPRWQLTAPNDEWAHCWVLHELLHRGFGISNKAACIFPSLGASVCFINCIRVMLGYGARPVWLGKRGAFEWKQRATQSGESARLGDGVLWCV